MRLRKSKNNIEDVAYSYVVLRKGDRRLYKGITFHLNSLKIENEWKRLVFTPLKKHGHVNIDTCSPNGELERLVVSRRHGKQLYYDARKSHLNDLWPHKHTGTITIK